MYYKVTTTQESYGIEYTIDFYKKYKKIGYAIIVNSNALPYKGIIYIWYFEIVKQYRGKGLGKKAFKMIVNYFKNNRMLFLHVHNDKQIAQYIYTQMGFKIRFINPINNMITMYKKG
jgi:ribosomal protein S18 acetylase RimI-like enzyme